MNIVASDYLIRIK